jgi:hypothetical protein
MAALASVAAGIVVAWNRPQPGQQLETFGVISTMEITSGKLGDHHQRGKAKSSGNARASPGKSTRKRSPTARAMPSIAVRWERLSLS